MSGIATVEDALANIDAAPGHIDLIIHIGDLIDRSTMNAHAQLDIGVLLQCLLDLQRAPDWLFRAAKEKQRHAVSRRHADQFAVFFGRSKALRAAHDPFQFLQQFDLLIDEQLRVTDDVD